MNRWISAFAAFILTIAAPLATAAQSAPIGSKPVLSLEAARGMVAAAEKAAVANHWQMVIVVVDDGGNLMLLERMDGAHLASIAIAQQKAKTAATFNTASKDVGDWLTSSSAVLKLDAFPYEGGIPIMIQGKQVGSIGVSGGDAATMDGKVAQAGIDWLKANTGK
jgi:glc operon protein GlcG